MTRLRSVLALALLAVLASGLVVPELHRAAHAIEGVAEAEAHLADHHAGHDHGAPGVEMPCPPELAEPDCAVCAVPATALAVTHAADRPDTDSPARLAAEVRAERLATASSGARGPPTA